MHITDTNIYRTETEDPALSAAHADGWQAYMNRNPRSMNPHDAGTVERAMWTEGWEDAETFAATERE